jgi:hypothetical protein
VFGLGTAVRYRGFGSAFSPEVGLHWSRRHVQDGAEDLAQRELFVRLRWVPARGAYLGLRYRRRHRDYAVDDPLARNFGRKDTRQQWALSADLRPGARRSWRLYYAREGSDSTRASGVFTTQLLGVGLTVRF